MSKSLLFLLFLVFYPNPRLTNEFPLYFITWDVGQGSWNTLITAKECLHIDMGGDKVDWQQLIKYCRHKANSLFLTHADWDHISFIKQAKYKLKNLCLHTHPREKISIKKIQFLKLIPNCKSLPSKYITEIPLEHIFVATNKQPNHLSRIFVLAERILITGDSSQKAEKSWGRHLKLSSNILWLIVGHHGSRTSTSEYLLSRLPQLHGAIISAEAKKYGHPHKETILKLIKKKLSILKTESLGHIKIVL